MVNTDITALLSRLEETCGELGLSNSVVQVIADKAIRPELVKLRDENARLRSRVEELEAIRLKWEKMQRELVDLTGAPSPDKVMHSLRNLLNELTLLRAISP